MAIPRMLTAIIESNWDPVIYSFFFFDLIDENRVLLIIY